MKNPYAKNHLSRLLGKAFVAGTILGAMISSQAQSVTTSITNRFDAADSATGWTYWYDMYHGVFNGIILDWNGANNNGGAVGSGSVAYTNLWPGVAGGMQAQIWGTFAHSGGNQYDFAQSVDGTKYDTISFDVHANADAPTNSDGNLCQLTVGFFLNSFNRGGESTVNIPTSATNGWYHVVATINKADPNLSALAVGWALNINCYGGPNAVLPSRTTPTLLFIDNIQANRSKVVDPPPSMSTVIKDAPPGLNLILNNQYDRTGLKTINTTGNGWLGQPDTTYSITLTSFPNPATSPQNQAHIFIATPDGASSIDYNATNLVWLNIEGNGNGTGTAYFRYKIFEPNSNANMFGPEVTNGPLGSAWAGQLARLDAASPIGTWSMMFNQDTNVTLRGPGGVSTNFTILPEVAAQFVDPLAVVFGAQPNNNPPASGQAVVVSRASITNNSGGVTLDDDFLADNGTLNSSIWTISAASALNVQLFPNDPGQKLVKWTLPDGSFGLQTTTNLVNPNSWTTLSGGEVLTPITTFTTPGFRNGLVPSANLGANQSYFRLFTRKFAKLQVLLPGETAAPGTPTGKIGTPDSQSIGIPFNVTVNAVNSDWQLSPYASDHSIHLVSTDNTATLPADTDLTSGTVTMSVTLNASGNFTLTASDVTDNTKTANTSSTVNIQ